ncbi:MAG: DEAD/DEAH box helicase family protein [Candidatus Pacearchaeota archaeon]
MSSEKQKALLIIKNDKLFLSLNDLNFLKNIEEALTFQDTSKSFINGVFDKRRVKLVKFSFRVKDTEMPTISIPIGFLKFILSVIKDFDYKIIDQRPVLGDIDFSKLDESLNGIKLYNHQKEAIKRALSERRGIVMSPTGSGKTEIFLSMLKLLKEPTLIVFNRTQLAHQTLERARNRGIDAGIVQAQNILEKNNPYHIVLYYYFNN